MSIDHITKDMVQLGKEHSGKDISKKDFHWTLSVPALWSDAAKQFMREAATEAQLDTNDITIALDTESASLFCQQTAEAKAESGVEGEISKFPPGTRYVIIDAGGGKIEISVFEVGSSGNLKEIHAAVGCNLGGNAVDEAFESTLEEIFGREVLKAFKDEEMIDWLQLWETFEQKKRALQADAFTSVIIEIPSTLMELTKRITGLDTELKVKQSRHANDIEINEKEIRLSNRLMMTFFERPVKETVDNVKAILGKIENIDKIVMVGGLSASPVFQGAIKSEFPDAEVLNPEGEAVAAGAVIFQQKPEVLTQRILKKTYGVDILSNFIAGVHSIEKLNIIDGKMYCNDVFSKHVEKGQRIKVGEVQEENQYVPVHDNQKSICFQLFASDEQSPMYTDDCNKIGEITVDISDVPEDRQKVVYVAFTFSETEIKVTARVAETGKSIAATCNFLG